MLCFLHVCHKPVFMSKTFVNSIILMNKEHSMNVFIFNNGCSIYSLTTIEHLTCFNFYFYYNV